MHIRIITLLAVALLPAPQQEEERPATIPAKDFQKYRDMIRPYPGEYRWREEIPWLISLGEARRKAAAEGKPLFIWASANSHPLGMT